MAWRASASSFHSHNKHGGDGVQPLSKIQIQRDVYKLHENASVTANPVLLGTKGEDSQWVTVEVGTPKPSEVDWLAVFSPANFKYYRFANDSNSDYSKTGKTSLKFQLINQREDFSFALFSGGLSNPKLVAVSNVITFANPKAPLYPRLALGQHWDEMTVTWTSGYNIDEAVPLVEYWGIKGESQTSSPAGTLTFTRETMCGPPARTVGWRDPGFIHTGFLKDLWPNSLYTYKLGHSLSNSSYIWSKSYSFKSSPYPGQDSLQHVVMFGDMGKAERDGSNEYADYQPGSLITRDQLVKELDGVDIVFHIGDMAYSNGYISQWDQFTSQVKPIASTVPYMVARYSTDYGKFHFCIADSEHDWREGSELYKFIEKCLASADRQKQPWLIFAAHRVLGYSSAYWNDGSFGEPMARENLQKLWQKCKVDIAFFGHIHNYERTCPIYQNQCVNSETSHYSGTVNGTIHAVVGGGAREPLIRFRTSAV
ncbi:putative phosphodiesterase I [Rosa chinensis]|uniref:Purple acid phosphatase n=1 Tax=Rosa chinensis TaxID=74649 RepID=A0A2P6P4X6_ROSCH|nr:putative phosphodiesterase I [Rosa chinensis]